MRFSFDMLALTGDSRVADKLEMAALNAWAGAQHPSGRWCTYNTPMDGVREASAHTIVFQSRAGTPELNCCSVNGPRGWGMLSEWTVMRSSNGIVLNWFAPAQIKRSLPDKTPVQIQITGNYPVDDTAEIAINPERSAEFPLFVRIPLWSTNTTVTVNDTASPKPIPGSYLRLQRRWKPGDKISLK